MKTCSFRTQYVNLYYILIFLNVTVNSQTTTDYKNVLTEIFTTNSYDKRVRPTVGSNPVTLDLSLYFLGINEIDEKKEKLVTTGYLYISWQDSGLNWSSSSHGNLDRIFVPQTDVWKPDIFLQNGFKKFSELGGSYYYIEIDSQGTVFWTPFEVFESRCSMDTRYFPFDKQTCSLNFVVWAHSIEQVQIAKSNYGFIYDEQFQENSVWNISSASYEVSKDTRESRISFTFKLQRKPLYYVVNILLPIVFLGLLNGLVFVIPAETGEKTGYSVTVFLALAVFLTIVNGLLPTNSEFVSILGVYLLLQVVIGVIAILVTTFQLRLYFRSSSIPVEGVLLKIALSRKRGCCRKCTRKRVIDQQLPEKETDITPKTKEAEDSNISWSDVVNAIDFYCFWCFLSVYVLLTVITVIVMNTSN